MKTLNIKPYKFYETVNARIFSSLDSEISNGESITLSDVIPDNSTIEEIECRVSYEEILRAIDNDKLMGYTYQYHKDLYTEYIFDKLYSDEKLKQAYYENKYNISQAQVSRLIVKYNKTLKKILEIG